MTPFLNGFTDELVKLGSSKNTDPILREAKLNAKVQNKTDDVLDRIKGGKTKKKRNYLASSIIGAAITPLAMLGGRGVQRLTSNIMRAKGVKPMKMLSKSAPLASRAEIAGSGAQGAVMGSAYQALLEGTKRKID